MATQELLQVSLMDNFNPFNGMESLEQDGEYNSVGASRAFRVIGVGFGRMRLIVPNLEQVKHNIFINNFDFHSPEPTIPSIMEILGGFFLIPEIKITEKINLDEQALVIKAYVPIPHTTSKNHMISLGSLQHDIISFFQFTNISNGSEGALMVNINPENPEFDQTCLDYLQKCDFRLDSRSL